MKAICLVLVPLPFLSWQEFAPAQEAPAALKKALADLNKLLEANPGDVAGVHASAGVHGDGTLCRVP